MGERKGTNHYYPPDYDPGKGGLNKFLGTHALRERARKIHLGILIIRFEMPYNIWCNGCGNHIGMGVRYNAEKKKIGMYYSTPVFQFRMKCHLCDNHFEIKTDPGNLDYIIVSGARRQENRWDPTENGQVVPEEKATQKRLFDDAMFKLEHGKGDEGVGKSVDRKSRSLIARRDELWQDDFSANSLLRSKFRAVKRTANASELKDKVLLKKFGLDMKLVPEHESDVKLATLLSLKPSSSITERLKQTRTDIINRPVLPSTSVVLASKFKFLPSNSKSLIDCKTGQELVRKRSVDVLLNGGPRHTAVTSSEDSCGRDTPPVVTSSEDSCDGQTSSAVMSFEDSSDVPTLQAVTSSEDTGDRRTPPAVTSSDDTNDRQNSPAATLLEDTSDRQTSPAITSSEDASNEPTLPDITSSEDTSDGHILPDISQLKEKYDEDKVNVSLVSCLYNGDSSASE